MWIARIARPEAIYDASAAARTFPEARIIEENEEGGDISETGEEDLTREEKTILRICLDLQNSSRGNKWMLIRCTFCRKVRKSTLPKLILR